MSRTIYTAQPINKVALRSGGTIANEVHPRRGYC